MTLSEVKAMRDKCFDALIKFDPNQHTHSIGDASYNWDSHRDNLQKQFEFWDNLYNVKSSAGQRPRLDQKAV